MGKAKYCWTKRVMTFNNPETHKMLVIPLYTKARMIKPNRDQIEYIKRQQRQSGNTKKFLVVHLLGMARYVDKGDLMFEEEFNARRVQLQSEGVLHKE